MHPPGPGPRHRESAIAREARLLAEDVAGRRVRRERRTAQIALGIGGFGMLAVGVGGLAVMLALGLEADARFWAKIVPPTLAGIGLLAKAFRSPMSPEPITVELPAPPPPPPPVLGDGPPPPTITRWTD